MTEGAGAAARWVPVGRPASQALADAVTVAKGRDRLAPVTVAVPSVFAGLGLRRVLAALLSGLVNVRFLVPARMAELLGAPRLAAAGRRPLTRALRAEAVRSALAADPGPFGDVAVHPATVRSVERAFTELRRAGPAALAGMARGDERSRHLARVVARVLEATADCYDEHDLFLAGAESVRRDRRALDEVGHVVLHLPRRVGTAEATLLGELAAAGRLTVLLGWTGDATADEPSRRVAERLGAPSPPRDGPSPPVPVPVPTAERIVVAPDPDVEVRTVVRAVADRMAAGHPLDRLAVVYRSSRPYALLVHEHLAAAGIPHSGPAVRTLAQTAAGRVLLGLLRLPGERFSRRAVLAWLDSGPILEAPGGDRAPAPRWDALSRAVGIVAGDTAWHDALVRHGRNLAHRLDALEDEGEGDDGQARGLRAELDHVARLDAFVGELIGNATPPVRLSWTACAEWGRSMLARYLGGDGHRGAWPDDELEAARAVESALDGLCALDAISTPGDAAAFATVLEEQLRAPFGRQGRFGDGVFVGRVADAACLDLDTVFVLGMAEGAFPERHRPDPLLAASPDRDPSFRRAEERRDFLWVAATAPERVLSYPAADQRGQRERLPSRWLLDAASALAGRRLYTDDLAVHPRAAWLDRVASFPSLLAHGAVAGSAQEVRLATLSAWTGAGGRAGEHPLLAHEPRLALGLEAITARRSHRLSRWTGLVGPLAGQAGVFDDVQSPTGVQTWATCPRRFLFERVLRVAETLRPEEELQMSAVDRGNLIHAALERFLDIVPARTSPTQPWTAAERAQLDAVVDDLFADAERRGITGRPVLWRGQRRAIRRDVLGLLDRDEEMRAELGVVPVAGELSFGLDADGLPPVEVVTPSGRKVSFRGRIDRVDVALDGTRMVVFDYKSGSDVAYRALGADPVKGGRLLQLPVYALAAQLRYGEIPTQAAYWFVGEKTGYRRIPVALDERTTRRLHEVLEAVGEGVDAGLFPANPGGRGGREGFEHCTYCPYDRVCPGDRQAAWERVQVDVALDPYRRLAPGEEGDR